MFSARAMMSVVSPWGVLLLLGFSAAAPEDGCESGGTPVPGETWGLRINEVMYSPAAGPEWVEIVNTDGVAADLSGLLLTDDEGSDTNEGGYRFPPGTSLAPGAFLVVGGGAWTGVDLIWSSDAPALANAGDQVYLVSDGDGDGLFTPEEVVDGMSYASSMGANGDGSSLARVCVSCDGQLPTSWEASSQWGGTPGEDNDAGAFVTPPPPTPTAVPLPGKGKRVLFDAGHCQRCGNADWVITGGYSAFADALRAEGFTVESSTSDFSASILSSYDVLIIPEPQDAFTTGERDALVGFMAAGKGIMMIANHIDSDRNFSGWDSVEVFNGYQQGNQSASNDWLATHFGMRFAEKQYSEEPLDDVRAHPAVDGVAAVGLYAGTTVQILDASRVKGLIYPERADSWGPMVVAAEPAGGGRIVAVGDSSPFSDGSCNCGDDLTNNWSVWNHAELAVSSSLWLARVQ